MLRRVVCIAAALAIVFSLPACRLGGGGATQEPERYTVTFDARNGSPVAYMTDLNKDSVLIKPEDPENPGYIFAGWYTETETDSGVERKPWDFERDTVTENIGLYARWKVISEPDEYVVWFYAENGTDVRWQTGVTEGTTLDVPTEPKNPGYIFMGWYAGSGWYNYYKYDRRWDFAKDTVTEDLNLHAKWEKEVAAISFVPDGENEIACGMIGRDVWPFSSVDTETVVEVAESDSRYEPLESYFFRLVGSSGELAVMLDDMHNLHIGCGPEQNHNEEIVTGTGPFPSGTMKRFFRKKRLFFTVRQAVLRDICWFIMLSR